VGIFNLPTSFFYVSKRNHSAFQNFDGGARLREVTRQRFQQRERAMTVLVGGVAAVLLGLIGLFAWWKDLFVILKGSIPLILLLGVLSPSMSASMS